MEEYMNKPVDKPRTDQDVIADYQKYGDKRKVARIYDITVAEVNKILKRDGVLDGQKNGFYNGNTGLLRDWGLFRGSGTSVADIVLVYA